ncbi:hypothetical protein ABQF34_27795 [Mycolicibacterium boenickei]
MPQPALSSGATPAVSRKDRFLLAGVAMVSASAIAVTPVAQNPTIIQQAETLAFDLTASTMDATASPVDVYGTLVSNTLGNLELLGKALAADPAPLLSQVLENQQGYAGKFGAAFEAIPTSLQNWYNGPNGQARLAQAQAALEAGDIGEAYRWFNHSMLYAFQGAFGPIIAPGFILSGIPRGGTEYLTGIPEQIAQNFTNLVAATFTSSVLVSAVFQGAFATISGPAFELARVAEAISTTVAAGDVQGAFNAVVNTPGILVNAALNGFKYSDPDPETGTGGYTEWPALLTWAEPGEQGGARVVAGLLQNLLVNIPKNLANAIDNTPEPAPTAVIASLPAAESTVETLKVETPAIEAPAIEAPKVEAPAAEALKTETPAVTAVAVPKAPAAVSTTPVAAETADESGTVSGKATITDRIKAKFSEAKEARQAKAKEAKEAKAKTKETKVSESKDAKSGDSKADSKADSKGDSGSES